MGRANQAQYQVHRERRNMKLLAILAAGGFVLAGTTIGSAAGARPVPQRGVATHMGISVDIPGYRGFAPRHYFLPLQTTGGTDTGTATATATTTATPGPTVTPTGPAYPDATSLITKMINKLALVKTLKFKETTNAQQPGVD